MSADNGIYIAKFPDGFRVAYALAIENTTYYPEGSKERQEILEEEINKLKKKQSFLKEENNELKTKLERAENKNKSLEEEREETKITLSTIDLKELEKIVKKITKRKTY